MHFSLGLGAEGRQVGHALLLVPLRLERSAAGSRVTVPGFFVPVRRFLAENLIPLTDEFQEAADFHLRFQLPAEVLPLEIERARLRLQVSAPSRRVTVLGRLDGAAGADGRPGGKALELLREDNPSDPLRVDITEKELLRLDSTGGFHLNLQLSEPLKERPSGEEDGRDPKWKIEYIELEVTGVTR
jgi:hypothetical protein